MKSAYDVIIAGGGIVGAACALACARDGMSVAVVEGAIVGGGATAAGMGHVVVMDDSPAQFALTSYSQRLWNELAPRLPENVEYERTGTIWVAIDDEEMAEVQRKHAYYHERGTPTNVLSARQLRDAEPNLRPGMAGGLLVPQDSVLYPPCAAQFLLDQARTLGADLLVRSPIARMGEGRVVLADGRELSALRLINAAGTGALSLTPLPNPSPGERGVGLGSVASSSPPSRREGRGGTSSPLPSGEGLGEGIVKKRKGHLLITDRYPGFVRHQLIELGYLKSAHSFATESVAFNVQPRKTGQLLIGSSRQFDADHPEVDSAVLAKMLARAQEYMPGLASLSAIRVWTGFRAATPDKLPLIGPWPGDPTLFLATGHEGLGITTSLATAQILADHFAGRTPEIDPEPYLPSRNLQEAAHA